MNKAKKSLLFSLLSLVFALAITATSTYAWFMVNTSVTASNMQVGVKSDTTFLVISKTNTLGSSMEEDFALTGADPTIPAVLPACYTHTGTAEGNWQKGSGTGYDNGALNGSLTNVADPTKHYVHFTFYVGVTDTTAVAAEDLVVTGISVVNNATSSPDNTFLPAVSVVLNCGNVWLDYTVGSDSTKTNGLNDLNETALRNVGVLKDTLGIGVANPIDAYLYINGNNPVVKSSNAANLASFKVSITFGCSEGSAA